MLTNRRFRAPRPPWGGTWCNAFNRWRRSLPDDLVADFQREIVGAMGAHAEGRHGPDAVTSRADHHSRLDFEKHELGMLLVVEDDLGIDIAPELVAAPCFDEKHINQSLVDFVASGGFIDAENVLISRHKDAPRTNGVEEAQKHKGGQRCCSRTQRVFRRGIDEGLDAHRHGQLLLHAQIGNGHDTNIRVAEAAFIHIVEPVVYPEFYSVDVLPDNLMMRLTTRSEEALDKAAAELLGGRGCTTLVEVGRAAGTIVNLADPEQFDLVVMATRGLSGLEHVLLGSVAEAVLRRCRVPMLTVPGQ